MADVDGEESCQLNEVRVRFATMDDLATCGRLDKQWPKSSLAGKIAVQEYILAEDDGDPVGCLRLEHIWGKIPYIGLIWLEPAYRGQGNGRAILGFLETSLRERGHRVLLSSSQANEATPQAWHRAVGFRECGIIAGINEGGIGEVFFRKDL